MAANTTIILSLQARDWEVIVSVLYGTSDNYIRKLLYDLQQYYAANGNPQGSTLVPITTKEKTVLRIAELFYGNTVRRLYKDVGGSSFKRVLDALRLANNAVDNYIATQFAAFDAAVDAEQVTFRKQGRDYLMMEAFDNN